MQHLLALVEQLDELGDAASVFEVGALGLAGLGVGGAFVGQGDFEALVEKRELAQALGERVVVVLRGCEDRLVGQEVDLGAALLRGARLTQLGKGCALGVVLLVGVAVAPYLNVEGLAQRVDAGDADAMQASRNLVARIVELAPACSLVSTTSTAVIRSPVGRIFIIHRNAASVVDHGDGVVDVDDDVDFFGIAGQRLVD